MSRLQLHEIDDVDHPDLQIGQMLAQDGDGGERFQRRHVAAAGHDHVGLTALVIARPMPDADALGAVLDGGVHCQPLRRRVFAGDHDVDIVAAAQAMVHHRQQAVGIRRQINAHDLGLLVHDVVDEAGILVREAVVILAPDMRRQQIVQRGDLPPPRQLRCDLQPLGVLVEHRIDDVDERLVAVEQAMPPGEQVALEPALALVFAEHFHHAPGGREKFVVRRGRGVPLAIGHLKHGFEAVGERLVRTKDPEIPLLAVQLRHIAQEPPEHMRVADAADPRRGHVDRVVAEIRHPQVAQQNAAVGVRIRAHAAVALGRKFGQFRFQAALLVEEFLRPIAPQPVFQQLEMFGMGGRIGERHLVRAERAFDLQAIDHLGPGPALGRIEDDHRPARTRGVAVDAGVLLDLLDLLHRRVERRSHRLVHQRRVRVPRRNRASSRSREATAPVPRA